MLPTKIQTVADLTGDDKLRLMHGIDLSLQERHSRLMNEFDKFSAETGESIEFVYNRFCTFMNNMERNKLLPDNINEPDVNASRAKRTARNHDLVALVANTYASPSYSRPSQSNYVTHPPSMQDYDDDYQGDVHKIKLSYKIVGWIFKSRVHGILGIVAGMLGIKEIMLGMVLFRKLLGMLKMYKGIYEPLQILGKIQQSSAMSATRDDQLEDLNASVIMMARL
ncbi:hypothetical protein Tco_0984936 [Tanacetum coccineum]